jgi:hemerythrin
MDIITWSESLSVGVKRFDDEHKQLINIVNRLNNALLIGGSPKTMEHVLDGLVDYTVVHFRHEEEYMTKFSYPEYASHKKEHDDLTGQVSDFRDRYRSGKVTFSLELMNFLRDWLTNHIMGSDKKYKDFFTGKGL